MNVISTSEELRGIVLGEGALVADSAVGTNGEATIEVVIVGGVVHLQDTLIKGLNIRFKGCEIKAGDWARFEGCSLHFRECTVKDIALAGCTVSFTQSTVTGLRVWDGDTSLGAGNHFEHSTLYTKVLRGSEQSVLAFHKGKDNSLGMGNSMEIRRATASISNFGTYEGNVYYFAECSMVIAGCWQGNLEDFKEKAQEQGVAKDKYEAVYNYFKAFK